MILVRMTDQDRGGTIAVERRRQDIVGALRRIELPAGVKNEPFARSVLDLDARPANLMRAAVNRQCQTHAPTLMSMSSGVRTIRTQMPKSWSFFR